MRNDNPLAEVFGFPTDNLSENAKRYRRLKLCRFNNKVPNCAKNKADNPLGVCSVLTDRGIAITCPIRFQEEWLIAEDAAGFFFPEGTMWTSLTEVPLNDAVGKEAGKIDLVLVAYDDKGKVTDFGGVEIQGVYISGNVRRPFEHYMENPTANGHMNWRGKKNYPKPDYLSSSRKRLVPQLLYKGGILNTWRKKIAVVLDQGFFETLPKLKLTRPDNADLAWIVYDLDFKESSNTYSLKKTQVAYTKFNETMDMIARPKVGSVHLFLDELQEKLDRILENGAEPEVKTIDLSE